MRPFASSLRFVAALPVAATLLVAACRDRSPVAVEPSPHLPSAATTAATVAAPCEKTWVAAQDGRWVDPWNWSPYGEPAATDDVCFSVAGSYTVDLAYSEESDSLWVGDGVTLTFQRVMGGGALHVSEEIVVAPTASVTFAPGGQLYATQLINDGTVMMDSLYWVSIGAIDNRALMEIGGRLHQIDRMTNSGDLHTVDDATIGLLDEFVMAAGRVLGVGTLTLTEAVLLERPRVVWRGGTFPMRADPRDQAEVRVVQADLVLDGTSIAGAVDHSFTYGVLYGHVQGDIPVGVDLTLDSGNFETIVLVPASNRPAGSAILIEGRLQSAAVSQVSLYASAPVVNRGTLHLLADDTRLSLSSLENRGTIKLEGNASFDFSSTATLRNLGTIASTGNDTLRMARGHFIAEPTGVQPVTLELSGVGALEGSGTMGRVLSEGTIAPGPGIATLTIDHLQLLPGSVVSLDAAGPQQFDRLVVLGNARYAGTLEVKSLGSYVGGQCGQRLTMLRDRNTLTGAARGAFDAFAGPPAGSHLGWHAQYLRDSVVVSGYDPNAVVSLGTTTGTLAEGGSATITTSICLGTPVTGASVTATLTGARNQITSAPSAVVFSRNDWALPQRITLSAIDDAASEGPHADTLRATLSTAPAAPTLASGGAVFIADNEQPVDMAVTMVWANPNEVPGEDFERRFRVTNNGPAASTGSVLVLPALVGATYQTSVLQSCAMNGSDLECTMPALAAGASADVVVILRASTTPGAYPLSTRVRGRDWDNVTTNDRLDWVLTIP